MLEEIFKTNMKLLDEPEVKILLEFVQEQHKKLAGMFNTKHDEKSKIMHLCMYSEAFLIDGTDAKETIVKIMEVIK